MGTWGAGSFDNDALGIEALAAVERVTGEPSELRKLWHEDDGAGGEGAEWDAAVAGLRARLAG